jgi:hypothetical protein
MTQAENKNQEKRLKIRGNLVQEEGIKLTPELPTKT